MNSLLRTCVAAGLIAILAGCGEDKAPIGRKEMAELLVDVHLAESYSTLVKPDTLHMQGERNTDSLSRWYHNVFSHHHISAKDFVAAVDWYKAHPRELDSVYNRMIPLLGELEAKSVDTAKTKADTTKADSTIAATKKADSLAKAKTADSLKKANTMVKRAADSASKKAKDTLQKKRRKVVPLRRKDSLSHREP